MEPVKTSRRPDMRRLTLLFLVVLVPSIIKLVYYPGNIGSDDAFIHLAVARNVADGSGWGLNPGHAVNVSTSPLFTLLIATVDHIAPAHAIGILQILTCIAGALGLFAIYRRLEYSSHSVWMPLIVTAFAAFSLNLWRWNGDVMEAIIGFCAVAVTLYLFRDWRVLRLASCFRNGMLLGLSFLIRPELFLALALCIALMAVFGTRGRRVLSAASIAAGATVILLPWFCFSWFYFGSMLPTAFYAKSTKGAGLWNPVVIKQIGGVAAEAWFWPSILLLVLTFTALRKRIELARLRDLWLPVSLLLGILAFYYLRTDGMESPGRYLLPFEACLAITIGILLQSVTDPQNDRRWTILASIALGLHAITAIGLNQILIAPMLRGFDAQYRSTMTEATAYLSSHTEPSDEVLIAEDIGVVAWVANGRFAINDTKGLSNPGIRGLSMEQQIAIVKPRYVMFSLWKDPNYVATGRGNLLQPVWRHQFAQHGLWATVSADLPYNYTTICSVNHR